MTTISENNGNNYRYVRRSSEEAELGYILATAASAAVLKALPSFSNPFEKQITKEWANNHLYKDIFVKSVAKSGLTDKGLKIANIWGNSDIGRGLNACYNSAERVISLNLDKTSIAGFHELGHAMNHLNSKVGKFLQKLRGPGYALVGLMGTIAVLGRNKPKGADRNLFDWVQDNCGKIAFAAMLPTVVEEALASHKGIKLAKQAGLSDALVKNLKKFYGKALMSYGGYALLAGVSTFVASKITEMFTRPRKVEMPNSNLI